MIINKKSYLFVAMFSSLLFALILVLSAGYEASAQSVPTENEPGCNNMGCLWEENTFDLQPGNPNDCTVGCYYIEGLTCQATSSTECFGQQC